MDSTTVEKQLAAVVREEVLQSTLMAFRAMYDLSGNVSEVSTSIHHTKKESILHSKGFSHGVKCRL
jgi:hypothetical protein